MILFAILENAIEFIINLAYEEETEVLKLFAKILFDDDSMLYFYYFYLITDFAFIL